MLGSLTEQIIFSNVKKYIFPLKKTSIKKITVIGQYDIRSNNYFAVFQNKTIRFIGEN